MLSLPQNPIMQSDSNARKGSETHENEIGPHFPHHMKQGKTPAKGRQRIFTLLVETGRRNGDGLPEKSTGAAMVIYAAGIDENEAVRETVNVLKKAGAAPLQISGYGTLEERLANGHDISVEERELMDRALSENSVIAAQITPFYD